MFAHANKVFYSLWVMQWNLEIWRYKIPAVGFNRHPHRQLDQWKELFRHRLQSNQGKSYAQS